jgi:hypothetical protein
VSAETTEGATGKREQHRRNSTTEYRYGHVTVRVPAEPPPVTPQVARALLAILLDLTDEEFSKRSKDVNS